MLVTAESHNDIPGKEMLGRQKKNISTNLRQTAHSNIRHQKGFKIDGVEELLSDDILKLITYAML